MKNGKKLKNMLVICLNIITKLLNYKKFLNVNSVRVPKPKEMGKPTLETQK